MFDRILLSTLAAASMVVATPVFANDGAEVTERREVPPCCDRVAMLMERQTESEAREQKAPAPLATQPAEEEDVDVRNQSWGG